MACRLGVEVNTRFQIVIVSSLPFLFRFMIFISSFLPGSNSCWESELILRWYMDYCYWFG